MVRAAERKKTCRAARRAKKNVGGIDEKVRVQGATQEASVKSVRWGKAQLEERRYKWRKDNAGKEGHRNFVGVSSRTTATGLLPLTCCCCRTRLGCYTLSVGGRWRWGSTTATTYRLYYAAVRPHLGTHIIVHGGRCQGHDPAGTCGFGYKGGGDWLETEKRTIKLAISYWIGGSVLRLPPRVHTKPACKRNLPLAA